MQSFEKLEHDWAVWNDLDPAGMVVCSSGSAALHLALEALELPQGSEVVVPEFTMIACARAVVLAGLTPKFVDCNGWLLLDWFEVGSQTGNSLTPAMSVSVYGRRSAHACGYPGLEDLAEAHGVKPTAPTACWSFYRNKIVAGEEGGAVWFRDPRQAKLARQLRSMGFDENHNFLHIPRGWNYRLSNANAELVLRSLERVDENLERRRKIEGWYNELIPDEWKMPPRDVVWVYDLKLPLGVDNEQVVRRLNSDGIAARVGFKPMSMQPEFMQEHPPMVVRNLKAYEMSQRIIYLPVYPEYTRNNVQTFCDSLMRAVDTSAPVEVSG